MNEQKLIATAQAMIVAGKGILAMDDSTPTCNQRFEKQGFLKLKKPAVPTGN